MISRHLEAILKKYIQQYPVIAVVGPRQSGKTTLVKKIFPKFAYLSLENLDMRSQAENDPRGFLENYGNKLILDEIQRVPSLFSYLQEKADLEKGQYILTGSQQFLLMEKISQSLAGRIATFQLYPFSWSELTMNSRVDPMKLEKKRTLSNNIRPKIEDVLFTGLYPRIHHRKLDPVKWIEGYLQTYVERDIRNILQVENLGTFTAFLKIAAAQTGQLLNYASMSNAIGTSLPTIKRWLSLLETSGIVFLLRPYFKNYGKRMVRSPKLYFSDPGVICHLLSIPDSKTLAAHPLLGNIFESFIVSELHKAFFHNGLRPPLYFWRDKTGNEVDVLIESGSGLIPIEIKTSKTFHSIFENGIKKWRTLSSPAPHLPGYILYNGSNFDDKKENIKSLSWWTTL